MNMAVKPQMSTEDSLLCLRDLLRTTLEVIDAIGLPADIGAHLDLTLCRVDALITRPREG